MSFDPAMTGQEDLEQLLRQFLALRGLSRSGPPACDLLDASRLWNNPVHADGVIIPSK